MKFKPTGKHYAKLGEPQYVEREQKITSGREEFVPVYAPKPTATLPSQPEVQQAIPPSDENDTPGIDYLESDMPVPPSAKTSQDYIEELLRRQPSYINIILEREANPNHSCVICEQPGQWRCITCTGLPTYCKTCCVSVHCRDFRHRIQRWNDYFFEDCWLSDIGFFIQLGHEGKSCPCAMAAAPMEEEDVFSQMPQEENIVEPLGTGPAAGTDAMADADDSWSDAGSVDEPDAAPDDDLAGGGGTKGATGKVRKTALGPEWEKRSNEQGYPVLVVVDHTGLHPVAFSYCQCDGAASKEQQFMEMEFFPSTTCRIRTVFSFSGLRDYNLDNQECKTRALSYCEKLRRKTNPAFPSTVPDRHRELLRVSRCWRSMEEWIVHGFGHLDRMPGPGELTFECPACAHPELNLKPDWDKDPDQSVYTRQYAIDGNFSAVHQKQKNDDIWLNDGRGFFVQRADYQEHLRTAKTVREKSTCHRHHAVTDNVERVGCDVTGIGSVACLRHGFFIPHSTVDFQKGEQQKNMDFAVCEALKRDRAIRRVLLVYDVICQWSRNFRKRVDRSPKLEVPEGITLQYSIGDFHLHGHIRECFPRYSLSYMDGAGIIDGEIVETLWSVLNDISRSTRSASLAHRAEILNAHMNYSNWKKITNICKALVRKYHRAQELSKTHRAAFERVKREAPANHACRWGKKSKQAQAKRRETPEKPEAMDYYSVKLTEAPSMVDVLNKLNSKKTEKHEGLAKLIATGIEIQDAQCVLVAVIRKAGKCPTPKEELDIFEKRKSLTRRIRRYEDEIATRLDFEELVSDEWAPDDEYKRPEDDDLLESDFFDDPPEEWVANVESFCINLPSNLGNKLPSTAITKEARETEVELRIGQCNEALEALRLGVCRKAFIFTEQVRPAETKKHKTRAFNIVHDAETQLRLKAQRYRRGRRALEALLGPNDQLLQKYQLLEAGHLTAKSTFLDAHIRGQKHDHLPWFWTMNVAEDVAGNRGISEFFRINWLRSKELDKRAQEELTRVSHEMEWTINFFKYKASEWEGHAGNSKTKGHQAYACRQRAMWTEFAQKANVAFTSAQARYHSRPEAT